MMLLLAIAYVVVLWGLSTALIFYLDSLPTRTFRWSMVAATLVLLACLATMLQYRNDTGMGAVLMSFAAGLLAWGWTEMSLYMGYITGPRKQRCAEGCSGVKHFGHAVGANLWHELVVIGLAGVIWLIGNETALWCFIMLWLMHLSARLNVFLGVRNVSEEFVPAHMEILKGFLRRRNMNALYPFSCAILLGLVIYLISLPQDLTITMAATLATIGLLEHILLMLPFPIERMWHWSLTEKARPTHTPESENNDNKKTPHQHAAIGVLS